MEKSVATHEPTTTDPPAGSNELTPELIKLVEDAQVPCYPGCKYTVHRFINELMDLQASDRNVTDKCIKEIIWLYTPMMPKGGKIWEFADKIDELIHAYTLMRSLKSHGGDAESSTKAPNATSGKEILRDSSQDGDPQLQQNFRPTLISAQQSELVPNATSGKEILRDSIQDGDPQLQQNSQPTLMLFPERS
ncbi:hypothetical protein ABKV19_021844 [Rosa sericea]